MKRPPPRLLVALGGIVLAGAVAATQLGGTDHEQLTLDELEAAVADGEVTTAELHDRSSAVTGTLQDGTDFRATFPDEYADELTTLLLEHDVEIEVDTESTSVWEDLLLQVVPLVLVVGVFLYYLSNMQGGRMKGFGRDPSSRGKGHAVVTFADVAGCDEAIEELQEIKEFLQAPARFAAMGATIPRGVLLVGPPGTGKTLLARAVAGEADAPFFALSGSDFVEMFVGVGASRVRQLFKQAKAAAPAIIFVDEIDAVGRHRGAGLGGGHDEREQTLNQLLVEMDGFEPDAGVILIAATNRPDILDPALLRPGRFDRQIVVDAPDLEGRRAILRVHAKGKPMAADVDLDVLARRTPGFTGADLANLMNEGALLAARRQLQLIGRAELDEAIDRVLAGPERRSRVMSEHERRVTAYHEAGHALVGHVLPHSDPIHKVSIVARGRALGWTQSLPAEDRHLRTRHELTDRLAMLLGGRAAEELIFDERTTGAGDDIRQATEIARAMVTEWGMSDAVGPRQLGHGGGAVFLGREVGGEPALSPELAARIDAEVDHLLRDAALRATAVLVAARDVLEQIVAELLEHETLSDDHLERLLATASPPAVVAPAAGPAPAAAAADPAPTPAAAPTLAAGQASERLAAPAPAAATAPPAPSQPDGGQR